MAVGERIRLLPVMVFLPNRYMLAPMCGITNIPFRRLSREFGCGMLFTEMVSAEGLVRKNRNCAKMLESTREERPIAAQISANKISAAVGAAEIIEGKGFAMLNLNMGCPARKVVKGGGGAALMKDFDRAREIISAVRKAVKIHLSVKFRSGWSADSVNVLDFGRMAEENGADMLILHPRTREDMFRGKSDWGQIALLKSSVKIPVAGNGDVRTGADGMRMLKETGCDAVMVGRGALGNPWIFENLLNAERGLPERRPAFGEIRDVMEKFFGYYVEFAGGDESLAAKDMRKHLIWFTRGLSGSSFLRAGIKDVADAASFREIMGGFFEGRGGRHISDS